MLVARLLSGIVQYFRGLSVLELVDDGVLAVLLLFFSLLLPPADALGLC